jgi:hypothetical protein
VGAHRHVHPRQAGPAGAVRSLALAQNHGRTGSDRTGGATGGTDGNEESVSVRHTSSCTCTCTVVQVGSVKTAKWKSCFRRGTKKEKKEWVYPV